MGTVCVLAGFVLGVTTNLYDGLELAGHGGDAELLGIFEVSVLHNAGAAMIALGLALSRDRDRDR